ncbi:MAG: T9SS type A sorting domain-containing protein [Chlorobi bacterium]|nr:T9SS type A sorting domain-containing protein [Chlorobiota bacterium]
MKAQLTILSIIFFLFFSINIFSQRIVHVDPGVGTLNEAIDGDTTDTGDRVDLNTIYELSRGDGAVYILLGTIENRFPVKIFAQDGDGARPQLIPGVVSGGESSRPFTPRDDLYLKGLYVTNRDELGGYNTRTIRVKTDSARIYIEDCHIQYDAQSAIRLDGDDNNIFIIDSWVGDQMSSWNNGRGIDDRGNNIDTLYLLNSTFYNMSARVLRDDGGYLKYAYVNHCTFVNLGYRIMEFGECVNLTFTNNLGINDGFVGQGPNDGRALIEIDSLLSDNVAGLEQIANISYNNFYINPAIVASYNPDSTVVNPNFNQRAQELIDATGLGNTNISEQINFTKNTASVDDLISYSNAFWANPLHGSGDVPEGFRFEGEDFDFSYPTTTASYTAGTSGQPLGALTWFDIEVGVKKDITNQVVENYELRNNYPNPFNPSTIIEFAIPKNGNVELSIYNVLGQKIATLINNELTQGVYKATWNGLTDSGVSVASGTYIYRIKSGEFSMSKKMILIK